MRHKITKKIFGRKRDSRDALMKSLIINLIERKKIKTTTAKAKYLKKYIEKIITKSKKNTLHSDRQINKFIDNSASIAELKKVITPKLKDKKSGFVRISKLGIRKGDGAEISQIELL